MTQFYLYFIPHYAIEQSNHPLYVLVYSLGSTRRY